MGNEGKLAGKTEWAGRRRAVTRRAGFNATSPVQLDSMHFDGHLLTRGTGLDVTFLVPGSADEQWSGFGGWFAVDEGIEAALRAPTSNVLTQYPAPNWNKFGTLSLGPSDQFRALLTFRATRTGVVTLYGLSAGGVKHDYLDSAKLNLRRNMWEFAPEANFYDPARPGEVVVAGHVGSRVPGRLLELKSCNRCGRFLPVNLVDERAHLSFSSHCVAEHRRPCRHPSFGRVGVTGSNEVRLLEYGFQLECRFCKKFEVNAAHNPQRTAGQMKEDAARRRHFELLLEHLYGGSPQLRYKNQTNRDLASDVFRRFGGRCFKCGTAFASEKDMHLDHTRPLAMLWPLDETATALCSSHNSEKRDRSPADYYSADELVRLAKLTGVPLVELQDPSPNVEAIDLLGKNLSWFHKEFLQLPALQQVREGKLTADLVVKALRKVLAAYPGGPPFKL